MSIIFAIIFFLVFCFIGYNIYNDFYAERSTDFNNNHSTDNRFEVSSFNTPYENDAGRRSGFFLISTLDDIVTNNKKNKEHVITVVYKDITTTEETEIKKIRDSLSSNRDYDVSLDYDSKGYVNKFTIADIENRVADADNSSTGDVDMNDYSQMKEEVEQQLNEIRDKIGN